METSWTCTICRAKNAAGAKRCALCRNPHAAGVPAPRIEEAVPLPEWEEDSKVLDGLNARMERASAKMVEESLPPRGAIRLVVPNDLLGWLTVAIIVLALAMTLAVLKTMF